MIIATSTFVLGSGICGGASSMTMLIAGRVVQGIGAGAINVLTQVIISDLVPLAERGGYLALTFGCVGLGSALGPFIGGLIVQHSTWRWVFYLNLPIGGFTLALLFMFLRVNYSKEKTFANKLTKIDWAGNAIFIASATSIVCFSRLRLQDQVQLMFAFLYCSLLVSPGRAARTPGRPTKCLYPSSSDLRDLWVFYSSRPALVLLLSRPCRPISCRTGHRPLPTFSPSYRA